MMKSIAMLNGEFVDLSEPVINMEDRGYQFGDGVYEVTHVYNGRYFALEWHIERLFRSLRELSIPGIYTPEEIAGFHQAMLERSGFQEGGIYLQITRGTAPRSHAFPDLVVPCLTMTMRPGDRTKNAAQQAQGVRVITQPDIRWMRCDIKSLNLLGNVLSKQKAKEAGAFEAVLVRDDGIVTEGSSSNFFLVKDDVLWTHPADNMILGGVTRRVLLEKIAPQLKLHVVEKTFTMDFVKKADEAFLTGTSTEIMPVTKIDRDQVGNGEPGEITRKIQAAYQELIQQVCYW